MARQRELLSLSDIAEETGISYATLRNYVIKFGDEIPSEGIGRDTRYPRQAVKVFQRLRKESKPGRKPANALAVQAPSAPQAPTPRQLSQEQPALVPAAPASSAVVPTITVDTSGIERELAGIRAQLERIADARVEALQRRAARLEAAPVPVAEKAEKREDVPAAPAAQAPATQAPAVSESAVPERREGLRDLEAARNSSFPYRDRDRGRRHSWPAAPGRKGPRPE